MSIQVMLIVDIREVNIAFLRFRGTNQAVSQARRFCYSEFFRSELFGEDRGRKIGK